MNLGERIKELRKKRSLNQVDIENLTGIRQSTLSRIERGLLEPTFETLAALEIVFGEAVIADKPQAPSSLLRYIAESRDNIQPHELALIIRVVTSHNAWSCGENREWVFLHEAIRGILAVNRNASLSAVPFHGPVITNGGNGSSGSM